MDKPLAIFPWVEANQGLVTLIALALGLIAFLVEQNRANRGELHSRAQARRQEAIDRQKALDASTDAQRVRQEFETERLVEYLKAVHALTDMLRYAVENALPTTNIASSVWRAPSSLTLLASEVADSLAALVPIATFDPSLIISTQRVVFMARGVGKLTTSDSHTANNNLNLAKAQIERELAGFAEVLKLAEDSVDGSS
jgi:hypothetical protein